MKGKIIILLILIGIGFYFDIIPTNIIQDDFARIEEKYNVAEGFMPAQARLNDYINELKVARTKISESEKSFLEMKLYTAKGLNYLNETQRKIDSTGPLNPDCSQTGVISQAKKSINNSKEKLNQAKNTLELINHENKKNFRISIESFIESAHNLENYLNEIC